MIEKAKMSVAEYIAEFCNQIGISKIHGLMGGGASGLNDGIIGNDNLEYLCYHHEQSAGYAAIGEARLTHSWAILNPTTGCGGTNAITPLLAAWQDSIPLVVISGNVERSTMSEYIEKTSGVVLRSYGVQENNIIKCVTPITKYAKSLFELEDIEQTLFEAFCLAVEDRRGPVWIDIPADIQRQLVSDKLVAGIGPLVAAVTDRISARTALNSKNKKVVVDMRDCFLKYKRPLLLVGGGANSSFETKECVKSFIEETQIPVVATYAGTNVIDHGYNSYLGTIGIKGNRSANFALQNCDCLLVLGSRLPFAVIGYDVTNFASTSKILVVDIDKSELKKNEEQFPNRVMQVNLKIVDFLENFEIKEIKIDLNWLFKCKETAKSWNIINENKANFNYEGISIYHVIEELNRDIYDDSCFVVDAGSISYVGPTSLRYNDSRSFIFSPAQADMGCAVPSALGVASASEKDVYCITGDGSFMTNLQELAVLSYKNYNLKIILLNNGGYLSITNTQTNSYGSNRVFGEHVGRGITFPDYALLCKSFGIDYKKISTLAELDNFASIRGPVLFDVECLEQETIAPYQTRIDGKQAGHHDMAPLRDIKDLRRYQSVELNYQRSTNE